MRRLLTDAQRALSSLEAERCRPSVLSASCSICLDQDASTVFQPCGHLCACEGCAMMVYEAQGKCPICRADILSLNRIYIPTRLEVARAGTIKHLPAKKRSTTADFTKTI